jgi:hypothetical protein
MMATVTLATVNSVEAREHGRHGRNRHANAYHRKFGKRIGRGRYIYPGRDHHHWRGHHYWQKYHCNCYWCPSTRGWYYWSPVRVAYYPVEYILIEPPELEDDLYGLPGPYDDLPPFGPDGLPLIR